MEPCKHRALSQKENPQPREPNNHGPHILWALHTNPSGVLNRALVQMMCVYTRALERRKKVGELEFVKIIHLSDSIGEASCFRPQECTHLHAYTYIYACIYSCMYM